MRHAFALLLMVFLLGSCTPAQEPAIPEKPFKEACDLSQLHCADFRVSKDRIELFVSNPLSNEIGPIFMTHKRCQSTMHSSLLPGQLVKVVFDNCAFDSMTIEDEISIEYTDKSTNKTIRSMGRLSARVR